MIWNTEISFKQQSALEEVMVFIGLMDERRIGISAAKIFDVKNANITFKAEQIFIHPLLGKSEV